MQVRQRAVKLWREKIVQPAKQLTRGEVIVAVIAGLIGGIFPVPLVTTVASLLFARSMCLIAPQVMLAFSVNMCCTPLQIILIPVFARATALLLREDTSPYTAVALRRALGLSLSEVLSTCAKMLLYATLSWTILLVPVWLACRTIQATARKHRECLDALLPVHVHIAAHNHVMLP